MSTEHKQVTAIHPRWGEIEVDEGMKELLEALWHRGIDTVLSCQDNVPAGYVWIQFMSAIDAEDFVNLVIDSDPDFANRITFSMEEEDEWDEPWLVSIGPVRHDEVLRGDEVVQEGNPEIHFDVGIRFPRSDWDKVLEKVTG